MKIVNPTDKEITIQVKGGVKYTVVANGELLGVPMEHAVFWKGLHSFLQLTEEISDEVVEVVEEVKEEVVEVVEEPEEEVKEEEEEVEETIKEKVKKVIKKAKK